jgi:hypothetical protein
MGGWLDVDNGCPISSDVFDYHVEMEFGGQFVLVIELDALRELGEVVANALETARRRKEET